jgi:hypothetical protein
LEKETRQQMEQPLAAIKCRERLLPLPPENNTTQRIGKILLKRKQATGKAMEKNEMTRGF